MGTEHRQHPTVATALAALTRYAPLALQEDYDNAGLQVGEEESVVREALLTLDVTEAVVDEAIARGSTLIVAHHPLLFHPLRQVSTHSYIERSVAKAIRHNIAIIAMHTNLDAVEGGVNYKIAEKLALSNVRLLGEERVVEGRKGGMGIVGTLAEKMRTHTFLTLVKEQFHVHTLAVNTLADREISTVAVCGGAGAEALDDALRCHADAFLTGEMKYNTFFDHDKDILLAVMGHYQSEQYTPELLRDILAKEGIPCHITTTNTNPIAYF